MSLIYWNTQFRTKYLVTTEKTCTLFNEVAGPRKRFCQDYKSYKLLPVMFSPFRKLTEKISWTQKIWWVPSEICSCKSVLELSPPHEPPSSNPSFLYFWCPRAVLGLPWSKMCSDGNFGWACDVRNFNRWGHPRKMYGYLGPSPGADHKIFIWGPEVFIRINT